MTSSTSSLATGSLPILLGRSMWVSLAPPRRKIELKRPGMLAPLYGGDANPASSPAAPPAMRGCAAAAAAATPATSFPPPAFAAAVKDLVALVSPLPPGVSNQGKPPEIEGDSTAPMSPPASLRLSADFGGGAIAVASPVSAPSRPCTDRSPPDPRSTVFVFRVLPPTPFPAPGDASKDAYRFMGDPPEKFESKGDVPPAIIVDSAPRGDAPLARAPGEFCSAISNSSVMGNGDRGGPPPLWSEAPMPCPIRSALCGCWYPQPPACFCCE
mmetsp:Transcript_7522/g.28258  ORF Transcript_7522/g.28258 Transcript_7522/m.28258 type:complete len:270 (-) Transcript_7522:1219-2028(-)